jgi:hypothetical protein
MYQIVCVCVCVCACVRACVRARTRACAQVGIYGFRFSAASDYLISSD